VSMGSGLQTCPCVYIPWSCWGKHISPRLWGGLLGCVWRLVVEAQEGWDWEQTPRAVSRFV